MTSKSRRVAFTALLASTAWTAPALAQDQAPPSAAQADPQEIVVTAQKREENLQNVPISIQALGSRKLDQLNITNFQEYTKLLPSVTFLQLQPGVATVYMRGVAATANGAEGNHSGPLPAVGSYLDEQPITTIGGTLDIHIYDIARIESLSGPQGTLYGASSEAGTIRIITNPPDLSHFYGRVDSEVNTVAHGGVGGKLEGMINAPLTSNMALRVTGFYQRDAGFIDNVAGCRSFIPEPTQFGCTATNGGTAVNNAAFVKKDYNDSELWGGRAALKIDLDENWTATPSVFYQDERTHGSYAYDPKVGDLQVQHFFPEYRRDRFVQAALTIQGKVGNWDLTYAGAYLDRKDYQSSDYTDYAEAYDMLYSGVGGISGYFYFNNNAGNKIDPRQNVIGADHFKKLSQELRVASPSSEPFRIVAGLFFQRQSNLIHQDYRVAGLADNMSVNGFPGTLWLTQQHRVDKDYAMFGEASYDITPTLTATAGGRAFIYDNALIGFFGFGRDPANGYDTTPYNAAGSSRTGVAGCFTTGGQRLRDAVASGGTTALLPPAVAGGPCTNLAVYVPGEGLRPVTAKGSGVTYRFNLNWKATPKLMFYATWSRGFRPGGINRRNDVPAYAPDFLTNYEVGWKSTLFGGLRFNGAVYQQDWKNFQFAFLGANSFTEIHNGPNARIRGIEADLNYARGPISLTASGTYTDAKIRQNLCLFEDPSFTCTLPSASGVPNIVSAYAGTRLPVTPRFKISGTGRYTVPVGSGAHAYGQFVVTHQSSAMPDLRTAIYETFSGNVINPAAQLGRIKQYTSGDLSFGVDLAKYNVELFVQNVWDERGQLSRFSECGSCGQRPYILAITPRTIGLRLGAKF